MSKQIELTITSKHLGNHFLNVTSCPLAKCIKESNISKNPAVDENSIGDNDLNKTIGTINPPFIESNFNALKYGVIDEFKTTLTLN